MGSQQSTGSHTHRYQISSNNRTHIKSTTAKGNEYEVFVEKVMCDLGYKVIERNFHSYHGEIDRIFLRNEEYIVVEVKGVSGNIHPYIESSFDNRKIRKILRTFDYWCYKKGGIDKDVRLVLAIVTKKKGHFIVKFINIRV